ncbi:MAG: TraR/DksA C4-type zinc finger protein [Thermodesulfobacteriota bacterium]
MFELELSRFKSGLLFFYTDRVDQLAHMFWRTMDPKHPVYDPASKYAHVIEEIYQDMDKILGKALKRMDDGVFGVCDVCTGPISEKRLMARPVTTLCINCKMKQEKMEKLKGE